MGAGRIRLRVPNVFFRSFWMISAFLISVGGTIVPAAAQQQWERVVGAASDIALANDGTAWIVGATNAEKVTGGYRVFTSSPSSAQRTPVGGAALRVAVEGNTPWIVSEGGIIQRWNAGLRQWQLIGAPKAVDVGASAKGVWIAAEPKRGDDYTIYQWTGNGWKVATPAAGSRLDVDADGNAWVVSSAGLVHAYVGGQWRQFGLARDAQGQADTASDIAVDVFGAPWVVSKRGELWYFNKDSRNPDRWERRAQSTSAAAQRGGRTWYVGANNEIFRSPNIVVSLNTQLNVSQQQPGSVQLQVTEGTVQTQLKADPGTAPQTTLQTNLSATPSGELKIGDSTSLPGPDAGADIQVSGCAAVGNNLMLKDICEGKVPRGDTPAAYGEMKYREPGLQAFLDQGGASLLERSLGNPALVLGILNDPKTVLQYVNAEQQFEALCTIPANNYISRELLFMELLGVIAKNRSRRTPDEQRFYDAVATHLKRRKLFLGEVAQRIYSKWYEEQRRKSATQAQSSLAGVFNLNAEVPEGQLDALESALPIGIVTAGAVIVPVISIAQAWPVFIQLFPHAGRIFELTGTTGLSAASGLVGKLAASGGAVAIGALAVVGSTIAILKVTRAENFFGWLDKAIADGRKPVDLEQMISTKAGIEELTFWWAAATADFVNAPVTFRTDGKDPFSSGGELALACRSKSMNPSKIPAAVNGGRFERGPGADDALSFSNLKFSGTKTTLAQTVWQSLVVARINCFDAKKVEAYFNTGVAACAGGHDTGPHVKPAGWIVTAAPASKPSAFSWIAVSGRNLPSTALIAGKHKSGANLAVCRADMGDGIHPGKVWGANCMIGWGSREVARPNYEVLSASSNDVKWAATRHGQSMPANAVVAGKHRSGPNLLVCRADMGDGIHPGKIWNGQCHVGWGGKEVVKPAFDVLVSAR